jgi:hypothetical protein
VSTWRLTLRGYGFEMRGVASGDVLHEVIRDLDTFGNAHHIQLIFSKTGDDYQPFSGPDPQEDVPGYRS